MHKLYIRNLLESDFQKIEETSFASHHIIIKQLVDMRETLSSMVVSPNFKVASMETKQLKKKFELELPFLLRLGVVKLRFLFP
jgi:hypothetical protein